MKAKQEERMRVISVIVYTVGAIACAAGVGFMLWFGVNLARVILEDIRIEEDRKRRYGK